MTEPKRALTDLRPTAEQTIFADLRVTPALKAKLRERIAAVSTEAAAPVKPHTPWLRWGGVAGVAAAAVLALVLIGGQMPGAVKEEAKSGGGDAVAVAPAPAPGAKGQVYNGTLQGQVADTTVTVTASDAYKTVTSSTYTAYITDSNGNSLTMADQAAPNVAVSGVEAQPGRKIVLNAEYDLTVTDAVAAMQRFQTLAATTAGYVVDASLVKGGDGSWAGRLILRLPSGQYNGAITEIRRIGEVRQERQWSQDVTERYYDLEARIRIQEEYERKLQELAGKAATFDDWMKLTRQINDTRALVEQMQGSLKLLANQVEYSSINISFSQPAPGKALQGPVEPGLGAAMGRAFQGSLQWFAGLGRSLAVGAAAVAPFLALLLVVGLVAWAGWRRRKQA